MENDEQRVQEKLESAPSSKTMEEQMKELQEYVALLHKGMMDLSQRLSDTTLEACIAEVNKLEVKEGDVLMFSLPENFDYDTHFFETIGSMFNERGIQLIAMHKGIKIEIVGK